MRTCLADSTVVFNEIMYHPAVNEPDFEWIELHNQMAVNMDISSWSLAGGVQFKFPEGTVLRGGDYLVVAINPAALAAATGLTNVIGPFSGRLSNSGETLDLLNNNQRLMDEVKYGTDGDWPVAPDGMGVSLAKRDPDLASASPENWRMSAQAGGTPGAINFPVSAATSIPLITSTQNWRFDNSGVDRGSAWRETNFDDSTWSSSTASFHSADATPPAGDVQPIPTLFNTGIGPDGQVLPPGSSDPHYLVTLSAESIVPPPPAPALVIEGHPAWLANDAVSSWLGPVNPGTVDVAAGDYRCQTTFDLTGFDPESAAITLAVSADNRVKNVFLNGAATGISFVGFSGFSPDVAIKKGFVIGTNTLDFLWANDTTSPNPAGFRAKLSGTARTTSSPESELTPVRPTAYFRTSFVFNGNPQAMALTLNAVLDDGAIFYLNGAEIVRLNLPAGPAGFDTPAITNIVGSPLNTSLSIAPGHLQVGTNVLAVELHQAGDGLNDARFSAELVAEPIATKVDSDIVFNEIAAGGNSTFFVELANHTSTTVSLDGYELFRDGADEKSYLFPISSSIPGQGFVALTEAELGFRAAAGDKLVLFTPLRNSVADAVIVKKALRGRFPDGTGDWLFPARATPGLANAFALNTDVVINEVMYHSRGEKADESWIELFNRGTNAANLTNWQLDGGVSYSFAPETVIDPAGYLVVAKNVEALRALHPGIAVMGPFTNSLSHQSDLIVLRDANGNPANQVRYFDGGRWPTLADGGGSSLELRDPWANNSAAEAWAASRESAASTWSNYTYRAVAAAAPGPTLWKEFVIGLLDAGECLIDDIKVTESPSGTPISLLQNGTFENGAAAWRFLGTHRLSHIIPDPDNPANHVLDLIATGPTEHMHNHLETTLANNHSVVNGREYEVSFRAKWISGDNQLNTRLYFNRVARTTVLSAPSPNGTPGARNSTYETNIGPTFANLSHTPIVPKPTEPVTVSIQAEDPQGVKSANVFWSINGGAWNNEPLSVQPGGRFTGVIPGAAAGSVVQFYIKATDGLGASATFPGGGTNSRALYLVKDQLAIFGKVHNLRIIMTKADSDFMHADTNVMSNELLGATVLYDEKQVFYDVGVHLQSSERGRSDLSRVGFTIQFPPDQLFRGVHSGITIDRSGGYTGVGGDQDEIVLKHALQHAGGLPGMYDDLVRVIPSRSDLTGPGLLIMAKYSDVFLDSQFANGSEGSEFKLELIYYPTTTVDGNPQSLKLPQPDEVLGVDLGDQGSDPEVYRWFYLQDNNRVRNDYSPMIALAKAFSKTGATLETESNRLMDVDMWMRAVAFQSLWGLVDSYPFDNQHNFIIYFRPKDGRALPFLWDMDYDFGVPATAPLNRATGNMRRIMDLPGNQRRYLGHMLDIITTTYNTNYLTPWITHFGSLVGENFGGIRSYVDQRVKSVRSQLPAQVPFAITSNGGQSLLVNTPATVISGCAWINVKEIGIEGWTQPPTFNWTTATNWQVTVPLILGTNFLKFLAFDYQGNLIASNAVTVTSTAIGGGLDTDGDGMPDLWEIAHGLNAGAPDAAFDSDGDGLTNYQEYLAGTDPLDRASVLNLEAFATSQGIHLSFLARAGRSYSILSRDPKDGASWQRLSDFPAAAGDHQIDSVLTGADAGTARFYRLVTPRMP